MSLLLYLLFIIPPMFLAIWAQMAVKSRYAEALRHPARLSGAATAQAVLNSAGIHHVQIEMTEGTLSDHYDPRSKTIRLSRDIYQGRTLAAVGIAAHEAGHAIQDYVHYAPLVTTQLAWPVASFGSNAAFTLIILGAFMHVTGLVLAGIFLFGFAVLYQVINLPVEYNASHRAGEKLLELGIVPASEMPVVQRVLQAAAWTYVAATLAAVMQLVYYLIVFFGRNEK